jgi:hypothetical protein
MIVYLITAQNLFLNKMVLPNDQPKFVSWKFSEVEWQPHFLCLPLSCLTMFNCLMFYFKNLKLNYSEATLYFSLFICCQKSLKSLFSGSSKTLKTLTQKRQKICNFPPLDLNLRHSGLQASKLPAWPCSLSEFYFKIFDFRSPKSCHMTNSQLFGK